MFVDEIVDHVLNYSEDKADLDRITVVFPNKRAGMFFRKHLANRINKPVWSPRVMGMADFIRSLSDLHIPDRMSLVFELYKQFRAVMGTAESFERFYYWGEILLRDFDELDRYLVDARALFTNLAQLKEIESDLSHLSPEQQELVRSFWHHFGEKMSRHQKNFLSVWEVLYTVYKRYKAALRDRGWAYDGMIYRSVVGNDSILEKLENTDHVIFGGFNALSLAEEHIMQSLLENDKAWVIWDLDDYYFKDVDQEAGYFTRELKRSNAIINRTFKKSYGNSILHNPDKKIIVAGVPLNTGQAQVSALFLEEILSAADHELTEGETALVLPDEHLLYPVLNALPSPIGKVNITMGYPLRDSQAYSFVEALIELQLGTQEQKNFFHYRPVIALLTHPYLSTLDNEQVIKSANYIRKENAIWITGEDIAENDPLLQRIFKRQNDLEETINYLQDLLIIFSDYSRESIQHEFLYHFYTLLNRLKDFIGQHQVTLDEKSFLMLFRQVAMHHRLPFEGEPLEGLQIMGILETRNLDFKNVIVCSMNEDLFPPSKTVSSFIPYNLRRAYDLPTFDHQDALYAYLFYRMIHRAENIFLIYNTETSNGQNGEVSRYVQQLQLESGLEIDHRIFSTKVYAGAKRNITIPRDRESSRRLQRFLVGKSEKPSWLTPSALNTYLDCSLRFYFRYVAEIYEEEEVSEEIDPMVFGQILHKIMEEVYKPFDRDGKRTITGKAIDDIINKIDDHIALAFSDHFKQGSNNKQFRFTGENAIAREVIRKMVLKVLRVDKDHTPFEIIGLEAGPRGGYHLEAAISPGGMAEHVRVGGIIDRIDRKEEVVRILDYKTGKDNKIFENVTSLFNPEDKARNKAAFQTLLYGLIYKNTNPDFTGKIQAGLFNIRELFTPGFSFHLQLKPGSGKPIQIEDISPFLPDFSIHLERLLEQVFSTSGEYRQTDDTEKCNYCPYRGICRR
jgi:hypothetical protein